MGISRTYLDSYYLVEVIIKVDLKSDVERLLYKISRDGFKIIVPQTVLGETTATILKKCDKREWFDRFGAFANIISKYNIDVNHCLPPPQGRVFAMMDKLQLEDTHLDNTDIMILAQVLYDPNSKFFITPDKKLLNNPVIEDYERRLRDSGLRREELKIRETV